MPKKPRRRALERKPYSPEQIAELFSRPMFTGCVLSVTRAGKPYGLREKPGPTIRKDAYYWLPILGLWTGCRVEEMGAAMAADVKQEDGIWLLDLRERGDLKTDDSSPRPIPLHQGLLNTGFLDYVKTLDPGGRLFPDLPHDPNDIEASTAGFTKWWGRWSDANGFPDPALTFHGFRHTFKLACKGRMPEDIHDQLTGHKGGSVGRDYGGPSSVKMLAEHLASISFPTFPTLR